MHNTVFPSTHLEHKGCGCRGEVEGLSQMVLGVVFAHVAIDHHSFGSTLLSNQQHSLALLGDGVDEELCPYIVHHGHQDGAVLGGAVGGVVVGLHFLAPVLPLTCNIQITKLIKLLTISNSEMAGHILMSIQVDINYRILH